MYKRKKNSIEYPISSADFPVARNTKLKGLLKKTPASCLKMQEHKSFSVLVYCMIVIRFLNGKAFAASACATCIRIIKIKSFSV